MTTPARDAGDFIRRAGARLLRSPRPARRAAKAQTQRLVDAALARLVAVAFPNVDHAWRKSAALKIRQTMARHRVAWGEHHAAETARRRAERRRNPGE